MGTDRRWARSVALVIFIAAVCWVARPVQAAELYLHGAVTPVRAGVVVSIVQPGGVVREAVTDTRGDWSAGVNWRAGRYVLSCEESERVFRFEVPAGETVSGPWVFPLDVATPGPTVTPLWTPTAVATEPITVVWPTETPSPTTTTLPTAMPSATATWTPSPTWTPLPTEVYLVWSFAGEVVLRPTAGAWHLSLDVQESPANYADLMDVLLSWIAEAMEGETR